MTVDAPLPLPALAGSRTAQIRCESVEIPADMVLAGPGDKLLAGTVGGVGGLETSCLALGPGPSRHQLLAPGSRQAF